MATSDDHAESLADYDPDDLALAGRVIQTAIEAGEEDADSLLPRVSRRGVLEGAATLTGATLLGGAAGSQLVGEASAGSSQSGQKGTVDNPYDAYVEDINIVRNATGKKLQAAVDGFVVPVSAGLGVGDAIAPASTTTPIQDAIDTINTSGNGDGAILFPPATVSDNGGALTGWDNIAFLGHGRTTVLKFTDLTASAFKQTSSTEANNSLIHNLTISGSNQANRTAGSAIEFTGAGTHVSNFNTGRIWLQDWIDPNVHFFDSHPYDSSWEQLHFAGCKGRGMYIENGGPSLEIGVLNGNPQTADNFLEFNNPGIKMSVGKINVGGSASRAVFHNDTASGFFYCPEIRWEPSSDPVGGEAARLQGSGKAVLGLVEHIGSTHTIDQVIELAGGPTNNVVLAPPRSNASTINNNVIYNGDSAPVRPNWFMAPLSDIGTVGTAAASALYSAVDRTVADPAASGVQTITAGSTAEVATNLGADVTFDIEYWVAADPNAEVSVSARKGWNDTAAEQTAIFEEHSAAASADVQYRIIERA